MRNRFTTGLLLGAGWYVGTIFSRAASNVLAEKISETNWYKEMEQQLLSRKLKNRESTNK